MRSGIGGGSSAEKADCVVIAAGESRRMGSWKLLLPLDPGRDASDTVAAAAVRGALEACARVIVVVGYRGGELRRLFRGWKRVECTSNPGYARGMFSSIKAGMRRVETERCFLALADMPLVSPGTYRQMLAAPAVDCVVPMYRGKRGHPVLMSSAVRRAVLEAEDEAILRDILTAFPTLALRVEDRHILTDLDTPADLQKLDPGGGPRRSAPS